MSQGTDNLLEEYYGELRKAEKKEPFREMIKSAVLLEKHIEEQKVLNPMYYDIYGQGKTNYLYEDKTLHQLLEDMVEGYKQFLGLTDEKFKLEQKGIYSLLYDSFKQEDKEYLTYKSLFTIQILRHFIQHVYAHFVDFKNGVKMLGDEIEYFEEKIEDYGTTPTIENYIEVATNYIIEGYHSRKKKYPRTTEVTRINKLNRLLRLHNNRAWYGKAYISPPMQPSDNGNFTAFGYYLQNHLEPLKEIHTILANEVAVYGEIYYKEKKDGFSDTDDFFIKAHKHYSMSPIFGTKEIEEQQVPYLSELEHKIISYGYTYEQDLYEKYGYDTKVMMYETEVSEIKEKVDLIFKLLGSRRNNSNDLLIQIEKYIKNTNKLTVNTMVMLLHHQILVQIGTLLCYNAHKTKQFNALLYALKNIFDIAGLNKVEGNPYYVGHHKITELNRYKNKLEAYHNNYKKGNKTYKEDTDELIDIINGFYGH